ncbi:Signal transduction histidine kinase [Amycolatopsis marina]|uniref:histidine kinase n=2 Tax=Amycolatopsis marina TaxID=490629 RepID=A0A1I0XUX3_9PSEU|nr:Signal transduction histidine kinase [Amycolatopsis marina]
MLRSPWRVLLSRWPWRSVRYLLTGTIFGFTWMLVVLVMFTSGVLLSPVVVGVGLLAATVGLGPRFVAQDRARLRLDTPKTGRRRRSRWWAFLRERETWRGFGYMLLIVLLVWVVEAVVALAPLLTIGALIAAPILVLLLGDQLVVGGPPLHSFAIWPFLPLFGVLLLVPASYLWIAAATARAALVRAISTAGKAELGAQLVELGRSRARLLDAFEVERKRIERDLHDGAQQRLVSLAMTLGIARIELEDSGEAKTATKLVADAHQEARLALTELRGLIRGIHPQVLTDRGLVAAVDELADRAPVTVHTDFDLPGRPAERAESTVYFAVSEALSNATKHGNAGRVDITGTCIDNTLVVTIKDDGHGGADPAKGTGLQGLVDRVAAAGGKLLLASPVGGPTELRLEIPWAATASH